MSVLPRFVALMPVLMQAAGARKGEINWGQINRPRRCGRDGRGGAVLL